MKKFLSLLLAVMMVVSLLPVQALAEMAQSAETEQIVEPVNKESTAEPAKEQPQQEPEEVVKPQANEDGSIQFNVKLELPDLCGAVLVGVRGAKRRLASPVQTSPCGVLRAFSPPLCKGRNSERLRWRMKRGISTAAVRERENSASRSVSGERQRGKPMP